MDKNDRKKKKEKKNKRDEEIHLSLTANTLDIGE